METEETKILTEEERKAWKRLWEFANDCIESDTPYINFDDFVLGGSEVFSVMVKDVK